MKIVPLKELGISHSEYRWLVGHLHCLWCGGPLNLHFPNGTTRARSHGIPNYCSQLCNSKAHYPRRRAEGFGVFPGDKRPESAIMRRERHGQWRGGVSSEDALVRVSQDYKAWRKAVYERDDYTCQVCEARGVRLAAHHIKPFANHEHLRTDVANGITLCVACHRDVHAHRTVLEPWYRY